MKKFLNIKSNISEDYNKRIKEDDLLSMMI